jgi:hypothetical protein
MSEASGQRLALQRCSRHPDREAAARCLSCQSFYCRECITEHEGRVICAGCISKAAKARPASRKTFLQGRVPVAAAFLAGLFMAWFYFYCWARILILLPDDFHAGGKWLDEATWEEE